MMRFYWIIGVALATVMALLLVVGLDLFAMMLFQVPVAYYWLSRKNGLAVGMLCFATVVPILITGSLAYALFFGIMASYGLLLGILARRQVALGMTITLLTVTMFVLLAALSIADWGILNADLQTAFHEYVVKLESTNTKEAIAQAEMIAEGFEWIEENFVFLYFGGLLGLVMFMATAASVPLYWRFRSEVSFSVTNYQFRLLRAPEHLVWLAILLVGLWFWDSRSPNEVVRFLSWNGALALIAIYWLNGLSIVFYISYVWKWRPVVIYLLLLFMIVLNIIFALSIVGFFDTWLDFRRKASYIVQLRKSSNESDSDK